MYSCKNSPMCGYVADCPDCDGCLDCCDCDQHHPDCDDITCGGWCWSSPRDREDGETEDGEGH